MTTEAIEGDKERASVTYKDLPKEVVPGDTVLINDGKIVIKVTGTNEKEVTGTVIHGGKISNHKGINLPNVKLNMQYISPQDIPVQESTALFRPSRGKGPRFAVRRAAVRCG